MIYGSIGVENTIVNKKLFYLNEAHEKLKKLGSMYLAQLDFTILAFYIAMASILGISKIPYRRTFSFIYLIHVLVRFLLSVNICLLVSLVCPIIVSSLNEDSMGTVFNAYMIAWRFLFK